MGELTWDKPAIPVIVDTDLSMDDHLALLYLLRHPVATTVSRNELPRLRGLFESERIRGLLLGSFIGDALGGPIEFQPKEAVAKLPNPPKPWVSGEKLDAAARSHGIA